MNESQTTLPNANPHHPHVETGTDYTSVEELLKQAAIEVKRQSTNSKKPLTPMAEQAAKPLALEDQGIHLTLIDRQELELKAAGWKPVAAHGRSFVWRSPDGVLIPGLGYCWSVMKEQQKEQA
jgi:hypothetical protein